MESVMHLFGPFFYVTGLAWAAATAGFATLWLRARARAKAAEQRLAEGQIEPRAPGVAIAGSEMQQVQAALDAIAVEVERLGEGQRFTTNPLAGRQPPNGAASREHAHGESVSSQPNDR